MSQTFNPPKSVAECAVNAGLGRTQCISYFTPDGIQTKSTLAGTIVPEHHLDFSGDRHVLADSMVARYGKGLGFPWEHATPGNPVEFTPTPVYAYAGDLDELKWGVTGMVLTALLFGGWFGRSGLVLPYTLTVEDAADILVLWDLAVALGQSSGGISSVGGVSIFPAAIVVDTLPTEGVLTGQPYQVKSTGEVWIYNGTKWNSQGVQGAGAAGGTGAGSGTVSLATLTAAVVGIQAQMATLKKKLGIK